jgi:hypothetical protein
MALLDEYAVLPEWGRYEAPLPVMTMRPATPLAASP